MPRLPHIPGLRAAIPAVCLWAWSGAAAADPVARAGRDFLAYPGETIVLDGTASEAAGGAEWRWVQVGGPTVALRDGDAPRPRFRLPSPGRYTFELVVREGEQSSAPDTVEVIAVDPEAGEPDDAGCSAAAGAPTALWLLGLLAAARRRERGA
jgi:hypothetical protein